MPNPLLKVKPRPSHASKAFGTYAKLMNRVSLPAKRHPSEAIEEVCKSRAKEHTGAISFINEATVASVVNAKGK